MVIYTLSTGDIVERKGKMIVVTFKKPQKVLSTSVLNGGYREDLKAIFNCDCSKDDDKISCCKLRGKTIEEHMRLEVRDLRLDPDKVTGMMTAAQMENAAIRESKFKDLTVTAIVTAGVEVNSGRVGDPSENFNPVDKKLLPRPGTINIMLIIDADLPPGVMARALVTCTEAKTAALQELMVGSNYSSGLATGTGTDQTIIVSNPFSQIYLESAGKHSKLGELIGKTVKDAIKEALFKQNNLSPQKQHSMLRRLKRFGINEEVLWKKYQEKIKQKNKDEEQKLHRKFLNSLNKIDSHPMIVTYTSLYVHLIDQLMWGLLSEEEVIQVGEELLSVIARKFDISKTSISGGRVEDILTALVGTVADIIRGE